MGQRILEGVGREGPLKKHIEGSTYSGFPRKERDSLICLGNREDLVAGAKKGNRRVVETNLKRSVRVQLIHHEKVFGHYLRATESL